MFVMHVLIEFRASQIMLCDYGFFIKQNRYISVLMLIASGEKLTSHPCAANKCVCCWLRIRAESVSLIQSGGSSDVEHHTPPLK